MFVMEEVETFLAIARSGSLAQAARVVHVSQSTVSYRLDSLEKRLGQSLFLRARGSKSTTLTTAGRHYRDLAEQWERLVGEAARIREVRHSALALGGSDAISIYLFDALVGELVARLPQLRLTVETGRSGELCDRVVSGHLDVAFVFYEPVHTDLRVRTLARYPMVAAFNSPPSERKAAGTDDDVTSLSALGGGNEVYLPWGPDYDMWRKQNMLRDPAHIVTTAHCLPPVMRTANSWTVVPAFMADQLRLKTGCHVAPLLDGPPERTVYCVERKQRKAANTAALYALDGLFGGG
ncbi:LysR family transcriptional regulator [Streptomyces sp. NBC_01186]|uniref:LysR family transcriptional regulator n=1 Tax=unclassified Streptomyces TaxID=2593676 RepID=UPI002DD7E904|nr:MULTISPECIES: LysR family transcriptional regulator [unclassified Streptomyces]WSB77128.1 LysR family transcriptional regulator [Streptomyces sp. NBC_01775]WSS14607.1 LysR family transcriptional regulator [Streptomyces sp. NBC_01186]